MTLTVIAVLLLLLSALSGYCAARRAADFAHWGHKFGATSVVFLAWLALPIHDGDTLRDSNLSVGQQHLIQAMIANLEQRRSEER